MARWLAVGLIVVLAILAVALARFATRGGPGMSPDSRGYLMSAQFLGEGRGLSMWSGEDTVSAMVHSPPLYPALLCAADAVLPGDMQAAARLIGTSMFALNVGLIALLAWRCSGGSAVATILAAAAAVAAVDLLFVHSMVWTEPLFIFFAFSGLYLIGRFLDTDRLAALLAASVLVALAFQTRYAGATLILTVALVLALNDKPLLRRLRDLVLFGMISCTPMLLWMIRNSLASGDADAHTFAWHPPTRSDVKSSLVTFASWVWPGASSGRRSGLWMAFGALVAAAGVVLLVHFVREARKRTSANRGDATERDPSAGEDASASGAGLRQTLAWFVPIYFAFLTVSISFFDAHVPLDRRILLPMHVALIPLVAAAVVTLQWSPAARRGVVAIIVLLLAAHGVRAAQWSAAAPDEHLHYGMRQWVNSPTLAAVRNLPKDTMIFTNGTDVMYLRAGRLAYPIPKVSDPSRVAVDTTVMGRLRRMRTAMRRNDGRLVYFTNIPRAYLVPIERINEAMALEVVKEFPDGVIYRLKSEPTTAAQPTTRRAGTN